MCQQVPTHSKRCVTFVFFFFYTFFVVQVAVRQLPSPASSLAWHPSANLLLCGTTAGGYALWPKTVPTDQ
jgi:hypothetical protein